MRTFLILGALALTTLSGCLDEGAGDATSIDTESLTDTVPGHYEGHPAYGFLTNGMLPEATDDQTRVVAADGTVQWFRPMGIDLPTAPSGFEHVAQVQGATGAAGISVFGPLAFLGGRGASGPLQIVDISDLEAPELLSSTADIPVRDADTILYPDGRLVLITTAGGGTQFATDVTDPENPVLLVAFDTPHNNHNIAVVPGTPLVYNSGSGGIIDVVDYSDPENPATVGELNNGDGCHDITFFLDSERELYRAYCAAYPNTEIWDITDPANPTIHVEIPYPGIEQGLPVVGDGTLPDSGAQFPLSFSHLAMVNHDASVLIVGDETGGGAINGCDYYAAGESGPLGNLWFYDLSDEQNPQLVSHISPEFYDDPTDLAGSCTAHFGRVLEDTGYLVMAFYTSGTLLIDFNDIADPVIVDRFVPEGGDVWDAQYHQGYLITGDIGRGMDLARII